MALEIISFILCKITILVNKFKGYLALLLIQAPILGLG